MAESRIGKSFVSVELWLVVGVLLLLGYLFLRAYEGFVDEAEEFKAEQVRSNFVNALRYVQTAWIAAGRPVGVTDLPGFGNNDLNLNEQGWPVAVTGVATDSKVTEQGCREVFFSLLDNFRIGKDYSLDEVRKPGESLVHAANLQVNVVAVSTVCVYQVGTAAQDNFTLLYNVESGEVRMSQHQRREESG